MADEPPALNPFGSAAPTRNDAAPGKIELSDGSVHSGRIYLTRDKRLQIYDEAAQRQREVPLSAVKQIDCKVDWERMEKEWKFKETTSDEKLYTGRSYPARKYSHKITLNDGRTITGQMAEIIYLEPEKNREQVERYMLHKRDKGEVGQDLKTLVYVKKVELGARE